MKLLMVGRSPITLVRIGLLFLLAFSGVTVLLQFPLVASQEAFLRSKALDDNIPLTDLESELWEEAVPQEIILSAQVTTRPMLPSPSVKSVRVSSLNNGSWISFRLEWLDSTKNSSTLRVQDYRDSAAIQFAATADAPFVCMGQLGNTVQVLHWKGDWQEDVDSFYQDILTAYPNLDVNYYPLAVGAPPYSTMTVQNISRDYVAGWAAQNPLSDPFKLTPVEDLTAGGFGTLTTQPHQDATGRGVWKDGRWAVVISRPLTTGDETDPSLIPGQIRSMAFAVWDGANREVDGRKSTSSWITLSIDSLRPAAVAGVSLNELVVPLISFAVAIGIMVFTVLVLRKGMKG